MPSDKNHTSSGLEKATGVRKPGTLYRMRWEKGKGRVVVEVGHKKPPDMASLSVLCQWTGITFLHCSNSDCVVCQPKKKKQ